jgi:hypothetical protein
MFAKLMPDQTRAPAIESQKADIVSCQALGPSMAREKELTCGQNCIESFTEYVVVC